VVAYQAIDDSTHEMAGSLEDQVTRSNDTILAVSVMACWKGADQLVRVIAALHQRGIQARLRLVGPWPSHEYESEVRDLVQQSRLQQWVTITGKVPREQLYREMAGARIFALPSRCESFGIPAVEAQAFGTPVIGSSTTAMAEVGGAGGEYCDPSDLETLTELATRQLSDTKHWEILSEAARQNARKYRWEECSRPLMQMFDLA
jgi:glycosyltransferase involved in cell wall biosynthesis